MEVTESNVLGPPSAWKESADTKPGLGDDSLLYVFVLVVWFGLVLLGGFLTFFLRQVFTM